MTELIAKFEWGTLEAGFCWMKGLIQETHPWYSRGGATYVSSHGAIVNTDFHLPYGKAITVLAPSLPLDRRDAGHWPEEMVKASKGGFAMAALGHSKYALLEDHTGLFRHFATLKSAEDILGFANIYGPLGADASVAVVEAEPNNPEKRGITLFWAEPLKVWQTEIQRMATALGLWDLIQEHGKSAFNCILKNGKAIISVTKGNAQIAATETSQWVIAEEVKDKAQFAKFADANTDTWPDILLANLISEGLRGRIEASLNAKDTITTLIQPKGLIGGLWLQAALAIGGNKELKRCIECGTWFEVATSHGRSDKEYCSNACRMRAYRKRKKEKEI